MKRTVFLLSSLALLTVAQPTQGDPLDPFAMKLPRSVRLEYVRTPGAMDCPAERVFQWTVNAAMSFDPFNVDAKDRLIVTLRPKGSGAAGEVKIVSATDEVLWAYDTVATACYLVTDALGLMVGVMLDPLGKPRPKHPSTPPPAPPAPSLSPAPEPPPFSPSPPEPEPSFLQLRPPPNKPEKSGLGFELGSGLALAFRQVPSVVAPELVLDAGLRWRILLLALELGCILPINTHLESRLDQLSSVNTTRFAGKLIPCVHYKWLLGCGILQVNGTVIAAGADIPDTVANSNSRTLFFASLGARLGISQELPYRLELRFYADLLLPLSKLEYYSWVPPSIGGALMICLLRTF